MTKGDEDRKGDVSAAEDSANTQTNLAVGLVLLVVAFLLGMLAHWAIGRI